jgi:hypothetical protein
MKLILIFKMRIGLKCMICMPGLLFPLDLESAHGIHVVDIPAVGASGYTWAISLVMSNLYALSDGQSAVPGAQGIA